jgi:hypothetical protein
MADMAKPEDAACLVVDGTDCAIPAVGQSENRQVNVLFRSISRDVTATTDAAASAGARKSVSAIRHRQIRTVPSPAARHCNFVSVRDAGRLGIGQLLTA